MRGRQRIEKQTTTKNTFFPKILDFPKIYEIPLTLIGLAGVVIYKFSMYGNSVCVWEISGGKGQGLVWDAAFQKQGLAQKID